MSVINIFRSKSKPDNRFEQLVRPYIEGLYRFAFRLSQSQHDAEELVQLLLTKLYPKVDQLEKIERLRPWLSRALFNLYVDSFRKKQVEATIFTTDTEGDDTATSTLSPAAHTGNEEMKTLLSSAIQQLSHDHRVVILLHDAEGYTLKELETILQTPIGTLKSRLNRARTNLKELLPMEPFEEEERVMGIRGETS